MTIEDTVSDKKQATILVVDDTPYNLTLMSSLLKNEYRVKIAINGLTALKIAQSTEPPDIILLDIMMPEMDGYAVCWFLKMNDQTRDIPIIFLTAKTEECDETKGLNLGAVDYITKPISGPIVMARIKTHLEVKLLSDHLKKRNQFIKTTFGRFMSDDVVEKLLDSPDGLKLGGESLTVTVVMSDLRGFSALSEQWPPEIVVGMLNNYLAVMTQVIFRYSGIINEIIGDAILILFGAPITRPDDSDRAIACALEMQSAMAQVNQHNRLNDLPDLAMGIGVNTGKVVAGNIGSSMRMHYTVIGDTVNLSERVESRAVGGQVLLTESTMQATSLDVVVKEKLTLVVKGFKNPVDVYDVTGINGKYQCAIPSLESIFSPLSVAISMFFQIIEDNHPLEKQYSGKILKIAENAAIFYSDTELSKLMNLKISLNNSNVWRDASIIYAKITKVIIDEPNCYEMHFTFIDQAVREYLSETQQKMQ